jgi:hypothetical protein
MRFKLQGIAAAAVLLLAAVPAIAHHSFSAEFDGTHIFTLSGTLTKVDWINPHAWWYVDVKDDKGEIQHWSLEGYPPSELRLAKITRDMVGKPGDAVSVDVFPAKDGTKLLAHIKVLRIPADGREIDMWIKNDPNR